MLWLEEGLVHICALQFHAVTWASLIEQYDRAVRSTAEVICFDAQVAWRFASLRATHNLRSADAIQLACAAHTGVDLFLTNDQRLHSLNIPGIGFITPLDRAPL